MCIYQRLGNNMEMKKYKLGVPCLTAGRAFRGFAIASLLRNGYAAPTIPNAGLPHGFVHA